MATRQQKKRRNVIMEMLGKVEESIFGYKSLWSFRGSKKNFDFSKVDYDLARAVYYASPYNGKGDDIYLGSGFAKPIVNSSAAFAFGKLPTFPDIDGADEFITKHKDIVFKALRNALRDGDSYLRIDSNGTRLVSPDKVTKVINPISGELMGFDITYAVKSDNLNEVYTEKLRRSVPNRQFFRTDGGQEVALTEGQYDGFEDAPLPMIAIHNEREPDQQYGNSEFQNLYGFMYKYHDVFLNAIENNIYNSNAVPVLSGIDNFKSFMEQNGEKNDDGTYSLDWSAKKLLMGGPGFNAQVINAVNNANEASVILNLLFWNIAQASETPEFIFGTAVQSSKASVSEQMPVAIKKAERKRLEFTESLKDIIRLWKYQTSNQMLDDIELKWQPILDDDMKLNADIAQILKDNGLITDKTMLEMLNMGHIEDVDQELKEAREETENVKTLVDQPDRELEDEDLFGEE